MHPIVGLIFLNKLLLLLFLLKILKSKILLSKLTITCVNKPNEIPKDIEYPNTPKIIVINKEGISMDLVQSNFFSCAIIDNPIITAIGPVMGWILFIGIKGLIIGHKKIDNPKQAAVINELKPVLAPALIPDFDSIYGVTDDVRNNDPIVVEHASIIFTLLIQYNLSFLLSSFIILKSSDDSSVHIKLVVSKKSTYKNEKIEIYIIGFVKTVEKEFHISLDNELKLKNSL